MRNLVVSFGTQDKAAITVAKSLTWEELSNALIKEPPEVTDKAARGWYIPATFSAAHRHGDFFVARDAITFDFDHVGLDAWGHAINVLEDWGAFCIYTTFSHRYDAPRFRIVIPLSRAITAEQYQACSRKLAEKIGIELVAKESFVPAQMMYLPTRPLGGAFASFISERKEILQVDELLNDYNDWTDRKEWPKRAAGDDIHEVSQSTVAPDEKPGLIGDFCRKYRVADAIRRFDLPYRPGSTEGRWTYTSGSVPDGAIEYDEGLKFHSHHDTDPCRGQNNAYDLVRLARFGHLDTGGHESLGVSDRPSSRAMVDFVLSLPEFRPAAADEFGDFSVRPEDAAQEVGESDAGILRKDAPVPRFVVQSPAAFADGPPLAWIVRKLLPRAELAVVYGESGSGKSFFALDLCASICRGVDWRGRKVERGSVVYVCAEGAGGFKARLRAYSRGHGTPIHELPGVIADAPNLLEVEDAGLLCGAILQWGKPDVIVIDTLSATTPGGNENSGEDLGTVISHCKLLSRKTGALVVLIHHSGKDSSKGARGWSGLRAAADAEIEITRNGEFRTATITKMKDGSDGESFTFKLKTVQLESFSDEPESSCIVEHVESAPQEKSTRKPLNGVPKLVFDTLTVMAPSGTCDIGDLIEGVRKKLPKDGEGRDLRRQQIMQAMNRTLVPQGYVFMHEEDRVSLTNIQTGGSWLDE